MSFLRGLLFVVVASIPRTSYALLERDVGQFDFTVATAGHGIGTKVVAITDEAVVTSGTESPCILASRSLSTGQVLWRRNACLVENDGVDQQVKTAALEDYLVTADTASGLVRCWKISNGALVGDVPPNSNNGPVTNKVWAVQVGTRSIAASAAGDTLILRHLMSGREISTHVAPSDVKNEAMWLDVWSSPHQENTLFALVGKVNPSDGTTMGSSLRLIELVLGEEETTARSNLVGKSSELILASTIQVAHMENKDAHVLALVPDKTSLVQFSLPKSKHPFVSTQSLSDLHPLWTSLEGFDFLGYDLVRAQGRDNRYSTPQDSVAIYRVDVDALRWDQWYGVDGEEETNWTAMAHCPAANLVLAVPRQTKSGSSQEQDASSLAAFWVHEESLGKKNDSSKERTTKRERHLQMSPLYSIEVEEMDEDESLHGVTELTVLSCQSDGMTALATTALGTTRLIDFKKTADGDSVEAKMVWTQEEGLAHVSSALLLDASHHSLAVLDTLSEQQEQLEILKNLDWASRVKLQMESVSSFFSSFGTQQSRLHAFGLVKVAVLLSSTAHRLWGMHTSGTKGGSIAWFLDLPVDAEWHTLVHGTPSSSLGLQSKSHSPEVLVLSGTTSETDDKVDIAWTCLEGTTGVVHLEASFTATSPVAQVIPLYASGSTGAASCHQMALLLHDDGSLSTVPNDSNAHAAVSEQIRTSSRNGLYTHVVSRKEAALDSFQVVEAGQEFATRTVGRTAFPGEKVVGVSYPQREEVVQSPCTVLGDDSLLLKYLNPHLVVVVTMVDDASKIDSSAAILDALNSKKTASGKKKPKGVTQAGESASEPTQSSEDLPNLFVNIMDTVSGRVLYRASHTNAAQNQDVPVVVTENWVVYAFFNEKTRRSELGVLTLYEGMIDKKGLTAFSSPEQVTSFSSLEARNAKPVVLTKTYGIVKPVTSLGVTLTRGGISSRQVLLALGDDRIMAMHRQHLEPRRPTGDVKETEKKEGLFQYQPLINMIPQMSPTYNQTINGVKSIISTPAAVESQSLVLAFGGPDIFFTRMSPSKGFDLLPDSFNRILLSIVVLGLLCVLAVVRKMGKKKMITIGWT